MIDDGSTDASGKKCDDYSKKDARIKVIHQNNRGLSCARNRGIDSAIGEWLLFVDSDDYVEPEYVELLYHEATAADVDIAICNYILRGEDGKKISRRSYAYVPKRNAFDNVDALLLFENKQYGTFFDVVWNKIFKKTLFDDIRFPEGISLVEDISIMPDLYFKAKRVSIIGEKLYSYVYREGSLSNGSHDKEADYRLRRPMMEQRLAKYKVWNIKELTLLHCIHMYSMIADYSKGQDDRLKEIQQEYRRQFFKGQYTKQCAKNSFKFFGYYRIIIGVLVILYFIVTGMIR